MATVVDSKPSRSFFSGKLKAPLFLLNVTALALLAACATYAPPVPGRYADAHIAFRFPEEWKITLRETGDKGTSLLLEPPRQGLVFIKGYPAGEAPALADFAKEFSAAAAHHTSSASIRTKSIRPSDGGSIEEEFDVRLAGVTVPHVRRYFRREGPDAVYFIVTHVPKEDATFTRPGFLEVSESFVVRPHPTP